jgi:hypothetical protein
LRWPRTKIADSYGRVVAAAVNPADLKNVWTMMRDAQARAMAGQLPSIDSRAYENVCSTDADVVAVWYRVSMLELLQMVPAKPLTPWSHDGEFDDAVFQVAATFPMKKLPVGIEQNGLPFDVQEFVKQIGART